MTEFHKAFNREGKKIQFSQTFFTLNVNHKRELHGDHSWITFCVEIDCWNYLRRWIDFIIFKDFQSFLFYMWQNFQLSLFLMEQETIQEAAILWLHLWWDLSFESCLVFSFVIRRQSPAKRHFHSTSLGSTLSWLSWFSKGWIASLWGRLNLNSKFTDCKILFDPFINVPLMQSPSFIHCWSESHTSILISI